MSGKVTNKREHNKIKRRFLIFFLFWLCRAEVTTNLFNKRSSENRVELTNRFPDRKNARILGFIKRCK